MPKKSQTGTPEVTGQVDIGAQPSQDVKTQSPRLLAALAAAVSLAAAACSAPADSTGESQGNTPVITAEPQQPTEPSASETAKQTPELDLGLEGKQFSLILQNAKGQPIVFKVTPVGNPADSITINYNGESAKGLKGTFKETPTLVPTEVQIADPVTGEIQTVTIAVKYVLEAVDPNSKENRLITNPAQPNGIEGVSFYDR